tara:strand:+ start:3474 stop:3911 length:438 start_codon:yes stop_codon:yes gene_type:complete
MNILVLHGPNLNLIGVRSAVTGERVTLDKIDRSLREKARELNVTLKNLQTHDSTKAITFLQRNRNWANGLLFTPGPWAKSHYDILDTLKLINIPTVEIHFTSEFFVDDYRDGSIFNEVAIDVKKGRPPTVYQEALVQLKEHLSST